VPAAEKRAPWRASYAAPERSLTDAPAAWTTSCEPPAPRFGPSSTGVLGIGRATAPSAVESLRIAVSLATAGDVEVGLLDHHGDPLGATAKLRAGPEPAVALFEGAGVPQAKAYRVRVTTAGRVGSWSTSPSVNSGFSDDRGELDRDLVHTRPAGLSPLGMPPLPRHRRGPRDP